MKVTIILTIVLSIIITCMSISIIDKHTKNDRLELCLMYGGLPTIDLLDRVHCFKDNKEIYLFDEVK